MRVFELLILIELPFLKQGSRRVLPQEEGGQSPLKGAPEEHGGPGRFFLPTIKIAMTVTARARQVLVDLGRAVDDQATSDPGASSAAAGQGSFQPLSRRH